MSIILTKILGIMRDWQGADKAEGGWAAGVCEKLLARAGIRGKGRRSRTILRHEES